MSQGEPSESHFYNFTGEKAGMQGIDRAEINRIIHEATKDSDFYKNQQAHDAQIQEKIASMKVEIEQFFAQGELQVRKFREIVDGKVAEIEQKRVLTETWIHIDMDMFYAAVEIRDNPELAEKPVAVGGLSMVCTANYVARRFGVRSAMPGFIAKKICPELLFVPLHFSKYKSVASDVRGVLRLYDPEFESLGLDEAHLWVTPYLRERNMDSDEGRQELAREIRLKVLEKTGLTASAGIACNKMLAKIGTDINKPNGQFYLPPEKQTIIDFLTAQNIRKIPGIGKVSEKILNELGITTCQEIIADRLKLFAAFSPNSFEFFISAALGISSTRHPVEFEDQKSISASKTFRPTDNIEVLENLLLGHCTEVHSELISKNGAFKTVTVFYKTAKFETKSRAQSIIDYTRREEDLKSTALKLLRDYYPLEPLRLLGVRLSTLQFGEVPQDKRLIDTYLKPVDECGAFPQGKPKLKSATPVPFSLLPSEIPPLDSRTQSVSQATSSPLLSSLLGAAAKPRGIKVERLQCPVCLKWRCTTEYLMSIHIQDCRKEVSSPKGGKKRVKELSRISDRK